ncbi:MAG: ABC transporter permease [Sphaerochaetaceae bacterium]|nr:ABC transporter permease [Sphaerochaetaceae bacterium]MDD3162597.1 ABC transporter permease [Sphaerochaetaceae bacterium]MDD4006516.1 ABC transporter permease [Sphaerochaetaceae bacterium]MDD4395947.1 ABC transporter permease [Sphaerochaetaceae bacterium]
MIWENTKLAFASMKANKMRTLLSLLGIIIGVGAVVAILTLGNSATESITDSISAGGLEMVSIFPVSGQKSSETFDEQFCETLKSEINGIDFVLPMNTSNANFRNQQETTTAQLAGVPSNYAELMNYDAESGEFFSQEDNIFKRQVCVLGADVAEELFPDGNAVGQYISIFRTQAKSYQVVGVMESKDAMLSVAFDNYVYVPYNTYTQRFRKVSMVGTYVVRTADGEDPIAIGDSITSYLDSLVGSDSYNLFSPATLAEMAQSITGTFSTFLAAIAAISLVVGGIGIMNIMLVSVSERTREIGVRKALGATNSDIMGQFITEAIALTLVGGFLGIILGTGISVAVTNLVSWTLHISYSSYIIAVGFSMVIGLFFGWYPARKAAKLDPIESLNYE